jgi:hypothetical protein
VIPIRTNPQNWNELGVTLGQIQNALNAGQSAGQLILNGYDLAQAVSGWTRLAVSTSAGNSSSGVTLTAASNRITSLYGGLFYCYLNVTLYPATTAGASFEIRRNGVADTGQTLCRTTLAGGTSNLVMCSGLIALSAGQYVEPWINVDADQSVTIRYLQFGIKRVGEGTA